MNKIEFISPSDKRESRYVGLDFSKENGKFFFPCQYLDENAPEEVKREEAKNLLYLLARVRQEYFYGGQSTELLQFYSMLWLVQDFIERGYYVEREKISSPRFGGKIDWKKTVRSKDVFFDDGNIVYKKLVRDRVVYDEEQTITEIYKCCLAYSIERVGFLFGTDDSERSRFSMEEDRSFMRYYLSSQLQRTFLDYKKALLGHLLTIVDNQTTQTCESGYSMYERDFEYVFEFLIDEVFGTTDARSVRNEYEYVIDGERHSASTLRPDTIMQTEDVEYILDAKYYNYGYTGNAKDLPQASAIEKQIGYNQYRRREERGKKVRSLFLLPYAAKGEEVVRYVGRARRRNERDREDEIDVYLIDLKELVHAYLYGSERINRGKLIEKIKSNE